MKNKIWLKLFVLLIGLLILGKLLMIFAIEPFVKNKIEKSVNTDSSAYHVKIGRLKIYLLTAEINISQINAYTDSSTISSGNISAKLSGSVNEISFAGISFLKALFKKEFVIDKVQISDVHFVYGTVSHSERVQNSEVKKIIIPFRIKINKLLFKNANLVMEDFTAANKFRKINFNIPELSMERCDIKKNDTLTSKKFGNLSYAISEINALTQDSLYQIKLNHIHGNNLQLSVDSILLLPQYDDYEFAKRNEFETDRIHLVFEKLTIAKFGLNNLIDEGDVLAGYININRFDADIFRDKRIKNKNEKKPLIQELLRKYRHLLKIDTLEVKDGSLKYTEHAEDANKPGKIYFTHLNAKFLCFTNDIADSNGSIKVNVRALLMDKSNVNVSMTFPVNDLQNKFSCTGSLASMNIEDINPMLERNAFIYATGEVKKMKFNFSADNLKSRGNLELIYNNLHFTAKSQHTDDTTALKEKIISLVTNKIIIEPSNPMDDRKVRIGVIEFPRNPNAFLFSYCWKSILSGIKSSIQKAGKDKDSKKEKRKKKNQ